MTVRITPHPDRDRCYLDAELRPHRSLSPKGFLIVMTAIAGTGFMIGLAFFLMGAWPVAGFCGLEILLVYIAFKLNYRAARLVEQVRLTESGLEITRVTPSGRVSLKHMQPNWLQVSLSGPHARNQDIRLRSHGESVHIGSFLSPDERKRLVKDIESALNAYRRGHSPA